MPYDSWIALTHCPGSAVHYRQQGDSLHWRTKSRECLEQAIAIDPGVLTDPILLHLVPNVNDNVVHRIWRCTQRAWVFIIIRQQGHRGYSEFWKCQEIESFDSKAYTSHELRRFIPCSAGRSAHSTHCLSKGRCWPTWLQDYSGALREYLTSIHILQKLQPGFRKDLVVLKEVIHDLVDKMGIYK